MIEIAPFDHPWSFRCQSDFKNNILSMFEVLHGEVSIYVWFAVIPCVNLLAGYIMFFSKQG